MTHIVSASDVAVGTVTTKPQAIGAVPRSRIIAWIVLVTGLVITAIATIQIKSSVDIIAEKDFIIHCNEVKNKVVVRLDSHARILLGSAAFLKASDTVTREKWRLYTQFQKIEQQLPGIQGIGFSVLIPRDELDRHILKIRSEGFPEYTVHPADTRDIYSAIIYLEPFSGRNLRAFGYDMFSEPVRRMAMERARDSDSATLSGKVLLVQETGKDVQAGILLYVPVYRKNVPIETVEQRREAIIGWVYSPYRMNDLIRGILGNNDLHEDKFIHLQIFDGDQLTPQSLLYACHSDSEQKQWKAIYLTRVVPVDFNGHRWTLRFTQTGGGLSSAEYIPMWLTLVGGAFITLLLFTLLRTLLNRAEALQMVEERTAELRESEERFMALHDATFGGIIIHDQGLILDCNQGLSDMTGFSHEELIGMDGLQLIAPDWLHLVLHNIQSGYAQSYEVEGLRKDGTQYPLAIRGKNIAYKGHSARVIEFMDITERKQAEKELQAKNTELERFTYTVSHDLKSPLITIQAYAAMILKDMETGNHERARDDAKRIEGAAAKMTDLLNDLLELSRVGRMMNEPLLIDMNQLMSECLEQLVGPLEQNQVEIVLQPDLPPVHGDQKRIAEVVQNLIENAIKYRAEQGVPHIEIGMRQDGKERVFFVSDNGKGIEPCHHEKIFGLFNKLDSDSEGTGVGLALVKRIIEVHGGRVWVESEGKGMGSRFCFTVGT